MLPSKADTQPSSLRQEIHFAEFANVVGSVDELRETAGADDLVVVDQNEVTRPWSDIVLGPGLDFGVVDRIPNRKPSPQILEIIP